VELITLCGECACWDQWEPPDDQEGECRRYAPRPKVVDKAASELKIFRAFWPVTFNTDGCHEGIPK
jgi:hypothetical protein